MGDRYELPLPVATPESQPFWQALKRHQFLLRKCRSCGEYQHPSARHCRSCWSDDLQWCPANGHGRLYTFTVAHRPAHHAFASVLPYCIGLIDLDEGPRFLANLVETTGLKVGALVEIIYDDVTDEVTLPKFRITVPPPMEQDAGPMEGGSRDHARQ
jgi:uncharacterized protein